MIYKIVRTNSFKIAWKKINSNDKDRVLKVLEKLANDEPLEPKHKDHKLKGEYKDFRECHILPDLLLIYQKREDILILNAFKLGSHSELF
ncbi:type II toxin-antitoxin system YafQ family toxin [Helicobacter sp. 13S00477-4]|uniref:type II toxin-antitoxin system RelE/ParE family toxin n=1 Tax=Helicobacter sp. 13S00477-4 TaxID=1905759 RepID=UPI000BA4ECE4|nr:type II toxin-antitoxin system YafQ family toxin [Helicobacter sp. 13S00477-4]PAF49376.1 addiction module toxin RelE [Helicobacter sp. 13S00477-4]